MKWDPARYVQFGDYRNRPFFDLVGRIRAEKPRVVVDLGCGPGNLTATLAQRWPKAEVIGLDSSEEMLRHAAAETVLPNLTFSLGQIPEWVPSGATNVVVTNAALQWVPGHMELLKKWLDALEPGAWFALQVPGNFNAPSHALMRELAESASWADRLSGILRHSDAAGEPDEYLEVMLDAGYEADAWETTYYQVLQGENAVLEWVRGAGLRPILAALPPDEAVEFESEYSALLDQAYPATGHGTVFPFRRTFAVAHKPA
ncbi:trans-aconitate 2-methyltransferase [Arthrobacter sp. R1-13]